MECLIHERSAFCFTCCRGRHSRACRCEFAGHSSDGAHLLSSRRYLSWIGLLTLDPSFLRVSCDAPHAYFDVLVGTLLVAVALPAAAAIAYATAAAVRCATGGSSVRLLRFQSRCVMCAVTLLVILYAPVASVVVRYFGCEDYGEYDEVTVRRRAARLPARVRLSPCAPSRRARRGSAS